MGRKLCDRHFRWTVCRITRAEVGSISRPIAVVGDAMTEPADNVIRFDRHLDHARELEREQMRLAKRIAELEAQMEQRITGLERRYAESN
jgi:hypothetical protein